MERRYIALQIAREAHAGQKRKDGQDYITHPLAVEQIALSLIEQSGDIFDKREIDFP